MLYHFVANKDILGQGYNDFRGTLGIEAESTLRLDKDTHALTGRGERIELLDGHFISHFLVFNSQLLAKVQQSHFGLAANEYLFFKKF